MVGLGEICSRVWQNKKMEKKIFLYLALSAILLISGCSAPSPAVSEQKTNPTDKKNELAVTSHTTENAKPPGMSDSNSANSAPSGGNSPMAKAVDVGEMTKTIDSALAAFKKNEKDSKAKTALSEAYFVRAFALTDAAQYRAALGDFRKGLKLDSANKEAKDMHDQILDIFKSIGREPPKEGEEPAPMPIK
jgi:tetratricopeptide (TPR) repeat protein